jgi:trigger factor
MRNVTATATPVGICHYTLDVTVPAAEVDATFKQVRKQFCNEARIPGFRSGKAPAEMIRKRYGPQILDEAKQVLVREALREAIQAKALSPVTLPTIMPNKDGNVAEGQDFAFAVEFDVEPQFELPAYTGLALTRYTAPVTDDSVEKAITELRRQRANYEAVAAPAGPGDLLKVSTHAELTTAEPVPDSAKRLLHADETWLLLNPPELIPGAIAALTGATAGTEKTFPVTFPADYFEAFLVGKQLNYTVKVIEVHGRKLPELTDAFAISAGAESAADLRAKVRERLTQRITELQTDTLRQQAIQKLLAKAEFPLPPKQLELETRAARAEFERQRQRDRQGPEGVEPPVDPAAAAALDKQAAGQAVARLRLRYLVQGIAKKEEVEVDVNEVREHLESFRQHQRLTEQEFHKRYDPRHMAEAIYLDLLRERVLDKIIAKAQITEQPLPTADDQPAAAPASA